MTTHTFSGFRVTTSGSTVTGVATSSMTWATTENFRFQYNMDAAAAGSMSSITLDLPSTSKLYAAVINSSLRVNLDTTASIGQWAWGAVNETTVMAIQTAPGVVHYYAMAGDPLPSITSVSAYNAFLASVTGTTSIIAGLDEFGPRAALQVLHDMSKQLSYTGSVQNDAITLLDGIDDYSTRPLRTGLGNDTITGTSGADWLEGGENNDSIVGNAGNDELRGNDGFDVIFGGHGNDTIEGGKGTDTLYGGDGDDRITGGDAADLIYGGIGLDNIIGGSGNDAMFGEDGNDTISGQAGDDSIEGGNGNDLMYGGSGFDFLSGGAGDDDLRGGSRDDTLNGGDGADTVDGGIGADLMTGDAGADVMSGGSGNDTMDGGADNDSLFGGSGDDLMAGGDGDDMLDGDGGNDTLEGGAGIDQLRGGVGNDILDGGEGDDALYGGRDADAFVFQGTVGADVVWDFTSVQGDTLVFEDAFGADAAAIFALAAQEGSHVVFDLGAAGSVTVRNTTLALVENQIVVYDADAGFGL